LTLQKLGSGLVCVGAKGSKSLLFYFSLHWCQDNLILACFVCVLMMGGQTVHEGDAKNSKQF